MRKPRVALSPITLADAPVLFKWINDRELVLLSSAYRQFTRRRIASG